MARGGERERQFARANCVDAHADATMAPLWPGLPVAGTGSATHRKKLKVAVADDVKEVEAEEVHVEHGDARPPHQPAPRQVESYL